MIRNPENHTPIQRFRLDAETWAEFGEAAGERGRAAIIKELIRWYLRKPGAKLPTRPE